MLTQNFSPVGLQASLPLCRTCLERPVAKAYYLKRGNYRCSRCYLHEAKSRRQAKWNSGYRPFCRNHEDVRVAESVYVHKGRRLCMQCVYAERKDVMAEQRLALTRYIREHKMANPCVDCGETDWRCLDFDHNGDKQFALSKAAGKCLATVKAEIAKCTMRCANCHRKRHIQAIC